MNKSLKYMFCFLILFSTFGVKAKQVYVSDTSSECAGNRYYGYAPGWYTVDSSGNVISGGSGDGGSISGSGASGICSSGNVYENDCLFDCAVGQSEYESGRLNAYCATYCTESDTFTYPGFIPEVEQGTKFTWTIGGSSKVLDSRINSPVIRMTMNKNCVVAFESDRWRSDYNAAKTKVENFNRAVSACGTAYGATENTTYTSAVCSFGTYNSSLRACVLYGAGGEIVTVYGAPSKYPTSSTTYSCDCSGGYYDLRGTGCYLSESAKASAAAAAEQVNSLTEIIVGCAAYEGAQNVRACGSASVTYDDEKYGRTITLQQVSSSSSAGSVTSTSSNSTLRNQRVVVSPVTYVRSGNTFSVASTTSLNFNQYKYRTYSSTAAWALPDYVYRYVLNNGVSIFNFNESQEFNNAGGTNEYYGRYQNYIDIGFPNYPVNFNSSVGSHDISLAFTFCGSSLFSGKNIGGDCQYNVVTCADGNCPPTGGLSSTGIDVIYRVIDLDNPFPGLDGQTRLPGLNWSINNTYVDRYITHNRGVNTEEVYSKEPMYSITLTPSLIQSIRNYNKENDLNDFKLVCNNGEDCRSIYLRELIENGHVTGCGSEDNFNACARIDGR